MPLADPNPMHFGAQLPLPAGGSPARRFMTLVVHISILVAAFALRAFAFSTGELGLDGYLSIGLSTIPVAEMLDFSIPALA